MRRLLLLALFCGLCGTAAAASWPRTVVAPGNVTMLAADGRRLAYVVARAGRDCDRIRIWSLQARRVTMLGRRTSCEQTSTGRGIAALSLAEDRALWLHYTGGNIREWTLWTATSKRPAPRRLRALSTDVDDPAPIVIGNGDANRLGDLLPYAVGSVVVVLRSNGARRFTWKAGSRVVALAAADGETAVAEDDGRVTLLDAAGKVVRAEELAPGIQALRSTGDRVLVHRRGTLEQLGGRGPTTIPLPRDARLEDAFGDRALYVVGTEIRELSLTDGSSRRVAAGSHAQASLATLYLSAGSRLTARPSR